MIIDYLNGSEKLRPFYNNPPIIAGIKEAIQQKSKQNINRPILTAELKKQYGIIETTDAVKKNIELLLSEKTFTVCTAHQPNLFTGPLYFVYKILHVIKLSAHLQNEFSDYHFVPVYYMGSEDADFAELNHTYVNGQKIEWEKEQTGAVGRMPVDEKLIFLIDKLEGQLAVEKHGKEVIQLLRRCYAKGKNIQTATFELINELYGRYGLVVLIPDNAAFKRLMLPVFEDDLFRQTPSSVIEQTSKDIEQHYKVQAHPREINLFYLKDNIRERIIKDNEHFAVNNTAIQFTEEELKKELEQHPERFSPNVVLRGLFQETVLPNIIFVGGGGELAYWLQLKNLFVHYDVCYPVLMLRNSFLIIEKKWQQMIEKLGLSTDILFKPELEIINALLEQEGKKPKLNGELNKVENVYEELSLIAANVDASLSQHVAALRAKAIRQLHELEKKLQRAERKKYAAERNQVSKLRQHLFPQKNLQERVENFSSFYAKFGSAFIEGLYEASLSLEQQFVVLNEVE